MSLALLTPWQQLLWLVCAFILIVPIIAAGFNAVIRGYFRAKEEHTGRMAKAIANALSKASNDVLDPILEQIKKATEKEEKKDAGKDV